MKRLFHNISLSNKLITLIAFSFIPLLLLIFLQIIPNVGDKFLEDKKTGLRNVVEATHGILDSYYQKAESGILTEEEAKKAAVDEINSLRYDKKEYFFMYDMDGIVRGLGSDPSKYGENRLELVDKKGNKFIKEMISVSQNEGAGYVYYYYPKLGETEPSPKLSYVKMFEPWDWFIGSGVYIDNVETALSEFKGSLYVPLFATIIGAIILILILTRTIVKPIKHLFDASLKFAEGQYDIQVEVNGEDEIGKLSGSFNQMTKNISEALDEVKHKTQIAEQAATEAEEAKNKMEENNKYLSESTKTLLTEMDKFAKGDLTVVLQNENDDDMARLMNGFSKSVEQIKLLLVQLNNTVDKTLSTSQEISHFSNELSNGTSEQSSQTEEVASAIHEMSQTIVETAKNASGAADSAREAGDIAKTGGDIVMSTVQGMIRIEEVVSRAAKTIKHLGASSDEIGNIIQVINDIADQTNLIALNAAIEAARAGEQGRGFAVVADEVRKLAERTTKATKEIADMIKQIQADTAEAVSSIEEGTVEVEDGKNLAIKAGDSLKEIISASDLVIDAATQVAAASEEQSSVAETITRNVESIDRITSTTVENTGAIVNSSNELSQISDDLKKEISKFNIDNTQLAKY